MIADPHLIQSNAEYKSKVGDCTTLIPTTLKRDNLNFGGLAQLARALALQARGHRFESDILHQILFAELISTKSYLRSYSPPLESTAFWQCFFSFAKNSYKKKRVESLFLFYFVDFELHNARKGFDCGNLANLFAY